MIGRTSGTCRFNIYTFSEVLELQGMEKVISKRDNFVVDALFYFVNVIAKQNFAKKRLFFCEVNIFNSKQ